MSVNGNVSNENTSRGATDTDDAIQRAWSGMESKRAWTKSLPDGTRFAMITSM